MSDPATPQHPTAAGMYDFYLGGTAHSPADRAAGAQIKQVLPEVTDAALANRGFLQRAVARMAGQWGIRQFVDFGAGLPTERNTHDVVSESIPDGRVLYVDIDPVAVARAEALLDGAKNVATIHGDIRQPDTILGHPQARALIDLTAPVGLLMVAVLHFVPDDDDPWNLVASYFDAVPSGSYLALSHISAGDYIPDRVIDTARRVYAATGSPPTDRSKTEIERFFKGWDILPPYEGAEPGLTTVGLWGAEDPQMADSDGSRMSLAAVACKP